MIAEGSPPAPGEDAKFEFYFPTEISLRPKQTEDGHLDYKEVSVVHSVEKDAVLVKKIPASMGSKGRDVLGNEIPALYGTDKDIVPGKDTYADPEDDSLIKSAADGIVFYNDRNHHIEVQQLYVVQSSVDYSTGNIHVNSSVIVKGDVKQDFSITTPYNVEIKGVADHAIISCGGTLKVFSGITGDGKQTITAGGDVHSGYIYNQVLKSSGSVFVQTEIRNTVLESEDDVAVIKPNGVIIGGKILAAGKVSAPFIGNKYNVRTEIHVGVNIKFKDKLLRKRTEKAEIEKQMKSHKQKISDFVCKCPKAVKKLRLSQFRKTWKELIDKFEIIKKETEDLEKAYFGSPDPGVYVSKTVYPGTIIKIREARYEVKCELSHVQFKLEGEEIHPSDLK